MEQKDNKALIDELRELASYERRVCEENNFASAYASIMQRAADVIEELMQSNDRLAARIIEGVMTSDVVKAYDGSALEDADKHIEMLEGDVERLNKENFGQSMLISELQGEMREMMRELDFNAKDAAQLHEVISWQGEWITDMRNDLHRAEQERDALLEAVKGDCKYCANAHPCFCWKCRKGKLWKWRGVQKKEG